MSETALKTSVKQVATKRPNKGKSKICFPESYVVVDIETTGFSPKDNEIIEIAALKYAAGKVISEYVTLVKPTNEISNFISNLTGITNEMVADAPVVADCMKEFKKFVGNEIIVGYNVNFDMNFLYDNLHACTGETLQNDFVDVMRIARRNLPNLEHYSQKDVAAHYGIDCTEAHRAKADCIICNACYEALKKVEVCNESITDIDAKVNKEHPLFGKVCVFTGTLDKMTRKDAMQLLEGIGGIPEKNVTKRTNLLILGNQDFSKTIKDGKSEKQKTAEKLILAGQDLQIIPEQVFYDLISDTEA